MLVLFMAKATLLLVAGAALAALKRKAPAGDRHLVWVATLAGVLVLPALVYVSPLRLAVLPETWVATAPAKLDTPARLRVDAPQVSVAPRTAVPDPAAQTPPAALPAAGSFRVPEWPTLLVGAWLAGASLLLGWFAIGALTVRRVLRTARPLDDAHWQRVLCEIADRLDVSDLPRLLMSDRVEVPFAAGLRRPSIVLPAAAEQWTEERRALVLVHELAHVRRRDALAQAVSRLACAFYWFHPLVWAAARRLRAESERACDDLVLACGARASDYAGLLLDVVTSARRHHAPVTAVPMARRREIEGRVLAILDPELRRGQPGRAQSGALLGGVAALLLLVSAAAPSPLPAQTPEPVTASEETEAPEPETPTVNPAVTKQRSPRSQRNQKQTTPVVNPARATGSDRRPLLAQLLRSDPEASVRRSAAWALAETGSGDHAGALLVAVREDADDEVREMAAWALAEVGGAEATAALAEALRRDASDEVRATAAWALGQSGRADVDALTKGAADSAPDVKRAALWALGQQRLEKAPPAVTAALRDADAEVRLVAAWALGEIRDPSAAPAVRSAFQAEQTGEVKRALFRTLAILGGSTSDLIDQALASSDPELREHAVLMAAGRGLGIWPWPWPWPQPRPNP